MTQYVQEKVETLERPVTAWALLGLIIALVLSYGLYINGIISNTIAAKGMQSQISLLTASVSALESSYLAAKSEVTLDSALALGFAPASGDTIYVSKANAGTLSFNR